jgi:hypothetical protein
MSDNKTELLQEVLSLFNSVGVTPGQGQDGKLMSKIVDELAGVAPVRVNVQLPRGRCPVCGAPNLMECDCDPVEQLAKSQQ